MAFGRGEVLEHGTTRSGRWLRERRIRVALWIALIEGILIVLHAIPWSVALLVAIAVVVGYFSAGNRLRSDAARQAAWIAAASQAVVAIVPILFVIAGFLLALLVVVAIAILALLVLLGERR